MQTEVVHISKELIVRETANVMGHVLARIEWDSYFANLPIEFQMRYFRFLLYRSLKPVKEASNE